MSAVASQSQTLKIALLKYSGGGDWYANPTSLPNLVKFCNQNLKTNISNDIPTVEPGSAEIFNYPFVHATGHGNVEFSASDIENLRLYLMSGGFLHFDDNYGTRDFVFREMKRVFPDNPLVEIPSSHLIFHQNTISITVCQKFTSTTIMLQWLLVFLSKIVLCFFTLGNVTLAMDGKILRFTTIHKKNIYKPCRWAQILWNMYSTIIKVNFEDISLG